MQPADTSGQSQNMLSELQREIREEEAGSKPKPAAIEEEKKDSAAELNTEATADTADDKQLITEETNE